MSLLKVIIVSNWLYFVNSLQCRPCIGKLKICTKPIIIYLKNPSVYFCGNPPMRTGKTEKVFIFFYFWLPWRKTYGKLMGYWLIYRLYNTVDSDFCICEYIFYIWLDTNKLAKSEIGDLFLYLYKCASFIICPLFCTYIKFGGVEVESNLTWDGDRACCGVGGKGFVLKTFVVLHML